MAVRGGGRNPSNTQKGFKESLHFPTKESKTFLMEEVRHDGGFRRSKDLNGPRGMQV